MKAIILAVGDELVSGQTVDSNSAHLSRRLAMRGIGVLRHETVGDELTQLAAAISRAAGDADVVLISGGLGPTADDLTRHAIARAMDEPLVLDEDSLAEIEAFFRKRGRQMVDANRVQAMRPTSASMIPNERGTAPGILARLGRATVFAMPGVPHEMRHMYEAGVAPHLGDGAGVVTHHIVHSFGSGESDIATKIADLMERGREPAVGTTVAAGLVSIRIVSRGDSLDEADGKFRSVRDEIRRRLGSLVIGEGQDTMASVVGNLLSQRRMTLATAESCTGGLIGEMLTQVPGASDYFLGGIISYANRVKSSQLGVDPEVIDTSGAVSEPVAIAMATGVRDRLSADWAVSATGIAGPTGGTDEKPVGTVWIGLAGPEGARAHRHVFPGDRAFIRRRTALAALNSLRLQLLDA